MEKTISKVSVDLLTAKASTEPLKDFPVEQLPLGLRDSLSQVCRRTHEFQPSSQPFLSQPPTPMA